VARVVRFHFIDQAQLVDVHRHLRVIDRPEGGGDAVAQLGSGHRSSSVEMVLSVPLNAAFSVCQASVAHFTRAGNSRTPEKTASLPSSPPGLGAWSLVSRS